MLYFVRKNLRLFLKEKCRPFYCILYGRRKDTWKKTRYISSALVGAFCACLICKIFFTSLAVPKKHEHFVLIIVILVVGFGFVFTDGVKCVVFLIFIALLGKSGRGFLRALCFAFVIAGPIENLSSNAGEIVRVFSCSKMLTLNLTRTRFDLMTKPFQNTLAHIKDDIREVQNTFNELRDVTKALHQEIMEEDPPLTDELYERMIESNSTTNITFEHEIQKRQIDFLSNLSAEDVEQRYKNKFRKRCQLQLESGKARCSKAFSNSLARCKEKMPYMLKTLLCWPLKIDIACKINMLGNPDKICDPSSAIPADFGQTYMDLIKTEEHLYQGSSDVKVHYVIASPETMPEYQSVKETAKSVAKEFSIRKRIFDSILGILEQVLAFMLFKVFIACVSYHRRYVSNIDHDNIYITEYFKHIDQDRKRRGKKSILPLRKYEKHNLIDVANVWQRTTEESRAIVFHLLQFALEIVAGLFFLFLDYVIVTVLVVIRKNSEMSFVQEGEHNINFSIKGSGLIARLLRTTMHNFNMHETVSTFMTNEPCLPRPSELPRRFYLKQLGLYAIVIFLIYQSAIIMRMRRLICSYFLRKREKGRILYLYNSLLKQRRSAKEAMLKQAKLNFANRKIRLEINILLKLRFRWPQHFDWLKRFQAGRRKCVICANLEDDSFVICSSPLCGVSYCDDCWQDMGNECLVCNEIISTNTILNFEDFFAIVSRV
ncbi:protein sneaky [Stomoxys calcitrans]|uniref:protein sneaky n=1 Tax=Stomoxys calcitrans TaxID=35570 RepID=UPI0027E378EB|nr:protein sneaky [Stomoxys calcitrans]